MSVIIRIGTRGSQLALWQARTVAALLEGTSAGGARAGEAVTCEIVVIKTSGDKLQEAPLSEAGGKRLFVREIEDALLDGRVDVAVHSAKDMPVIAVDGLTIAAVLPREEPWDAIVLPASAAGAADAAAAAGATGPTGAASDSTLDTLIRCTSPLRRGPDRRHEQRSPCHAVAARAAGRDLRADSRQSRYAAAQAR